MRRLLPALALLGAACGQRVAQGGRGEARASTPAGEIALDAAPSFLRTAAVALTPEAGAQPGAALTVPADAVLSDGEANAVVVALGKNRFQKRAIEVGPEQEGRVRVLAGLRPGEEVVVDGALFLKAEIDGR